MLHDVTFGTTNPAKLNQVRGVLEPLGITVHGLTEADRSIDAPEDGETVSENARMKARAYSSALQRPVLSMDNALFFKGLADSEQPGLHVRRIPGFDTRPTDADLLAHYAALVTRFGGEMQAWWDYALALAMPDGALYETRFPSPRRFVVPGSSTITPGYPLESIQVDPVSGSFVSDMDEREQAAFWQREIGKPIRTFIEGLPI